ncbi:anti-sigma factor [Phycicoccus sp. CSK15P-2]|uniref:anti-sigma factor n=1 Tax=Phycicoccus sp. CSK15P-2 TaxID=2807627 RepID=UPI00194EEB59|nr:anti-sigma factor [Phycicoccus sp. CSK15P-2]MBM6404491.1 anti-sigma factor [Phycicoccus sp. CSK15P-2]
MSPDLHHLSGAYAVDALDIDERSSFERHLTACPACRAEVAELQGAAHALSSLSDVAPPASLRTSVLSGIAHVRPLPPVGPEPEEHTAPAPAESEQLAPVVPLLRRPRSWVAAAAAAAAVVVGGVAVNAWTTPEPALTAAQQVQGAGDAATVTSEKEGTSATLAYSRELDQSVLTVSGLAPAPEGMTYQLWYVGTDEVARPAGFLTPSDGRGEALLQGSVSAATAVGVTVEPAGGSSSPTSDPIMVMAVA